MGVLLIGAPALRGSLELVVIVAGDTLREVGRLVGMREGDMVERGSDSTSEEFEEVISSFRVGVEGLKASNKGYRSPGAGVPGVGDSSADRECQ